jgi:hypothetical protein
MMLYSAYIDHIRKIACKIDTHEPDPAKAMADATKAIAIICDYPALLRQLIGYRDTRTINPWLKEWRAELLESRSEYINQLEKINTKNFWNDIPVTMDLILNELSDLFLLGNDGDDIQKYWHNSSLTPDSPTILLSDSVREEIRETLSEILRRKKATHETMEKRVTSRLAKPVLEEIQALECELKNANFSKKTLARHKGHGAEPFRALLLASYHGLVRQSDEQSCLEIIRRRTFNMTLLEIEVTLKDEIAATSETLKQLIEQLQALPDIQEKLRERFTTAKIKIDQYTKDLLNQNVVEKYLHNLLSRLILEVTAEIGASSSDKINIWTGYRDFIKGCIEENGSDKKYFTSENREYLKKLLNDMRDLLSRKRKAKSR